MINTVIRSVEGKVGLFLCNMFKRHKFIVVREPSDMLPIDNRLPMFLNNDGLRYCKYCKRLESFSYHCLGLNPPEYIVDNSKRIDYISLVGAIVPDPYNLEPEDLQLVKIIKPELYDYCKLYVNI